MCGPAALIMGAISVGGAVMQHQAQRDAADAANANADRRYEMEVRRAKEEAQARQNQLSAEAMQESERIGQQRQALALDALRAQSAGKVASAEGGLGGVSKIRSFLATDIQSDLARSDIEKGENLAQFNLQQKGRGIETAKSSRSENAFIQRQSSQRRKPGTLELVTNVSKAAAPHFKGFS